MNKIYVLFHRDSDGRFAGWCAHRHFNTNDYKDPKYPLDLQMIGVQYNEPLPFNIEDLQEGDFVHIVDFSYPREILDQIYAKIGPRLKVLDHHIKAEPALRGAPYVIFDNTKSGALLAWEYYFPGMPAPKACLLVNDRDLWKWEFGEESESFEAYLRTQAVNDNWDKWTELVFDDFAMESALAKGKVYAEYERLAVQSFAKSTRNHCRIFINFQDKDYVFAFYEGMGILTSEVGAEFNKNHGTDGTLEYRVRGNKMVFSMRGAPGIDVGAMAASIVGGGGHVAAAGFSMPLHLGLKAVARIYEVYDDSEVLKWSELCK